jgi:hypothetical protein
LPADGAEAHWSVLVVLQAALSGAVSVRPRTDDLEVPIATNERGHDSCALTAAMLAEARRQPRSALRIPEVVTRWPTVVHRFVEVEQVDDARHLLPLSAAVRVRATRTP